PASNRAPHTFPTRRSSDLRPTKLGTDPRPVGDRAACLPLAGGDLIFPLARRPPPAIGPLELGLDPLTAVGCGGDRGIEARRGRRSEEHTSELQSRENLVCR